MRKGRIRRRRIKARKHAPASNDAQNASLKLDRTDEKVAIDLDHGGSDQMWPSSETVGLVTVVKTVRDFYCTFASTHSESANFLVPCYDYPRYEHLICRECEFVDGPLIPDSPADEARGVGPSAEDMFQRISPLSSRRCYVLCMQEDSELESRFRNARDA